MTPTTSIHLTKLNNLQRLEIIAIANPTIRVTFLKLPSLSFVEELLPTLLTLPPLLGQLKIIIREC